MPKQHIIVMEDGELSDGEILSSHDIEDDNLKISPAGAAAPRDGQNHSLIHAEKNAHQPADDKSESQKGKKRNRRRQKKNQSGTSMALDCELRNDGECDPPSKKARSTEDGATQQAGDIPKVATIMQQNGRKDKKAKKKNKRNSLDSTGQVSGNTVSKLLQRLSQVPTDGASTFLMKTVDFSLAIRQLLSDGTDAHCAASSKRVVVVWLSQVSAKMFAASEDSFAKLKSLPGFTFDIENPGSAYFSKLGLEAFLMLPVNEEEEEEEEPAGQFTRANCLLSEAELISNGFPSACSPPQDWLQYVTLSQRGGSDDVSGGPCGVQSGVVKESCDMLQCNTVESCNTMMVSDDSVPKTPKEVSEVSSTGLQSVTARGSGFPMFALDCEMVSTQHGLELARVSVVDESLRCMYDTLVKPQVPVLDYLTRFSGITEETLRDVTTTLGDVQRSLVKLLPQECILVGHSLENDFCALKLSHPLVIDTSCLFTPSAPTLHKPGLRLLAKQLLLEDIQHGKDGHSSIEDAATCMKLVQKKLREGRLCVIPWSNRKKNLISELSEKKKRVGIVDKSSVVNLYGQEATVKACVTEDGQAVNELLQMVAMVDFAFVQLHAVEQCLKTPSDGATLKEVLDSMDEQAARIVRECATGSVVFVVCGSSCINEVKKYQVDCRKGKGAQRERLKEEVAIARHGIVKVCIV